MPAKKDFVFVLLLLFKFCSTGTKIRCVYIYIHIVNIPSRIKITVLMHSVTSIASRD